MKLKAANDWKY